MLPKQFFPDGLCTAVTSSHRCNQPIAPFQTWYCADHSRDCNELRLTYKKTNACGTVEGNADYHTMLCSYPADVKHLEVEDIDKIIDDFENREGKVKRCLDRRTAFRSVCRHADTQDQNHANDDARVKKLGTDCVAYISKLQNVLAEKWRELDARQGLMEARAREFREQEQLLSEQAKRAAEQAKRAEDELLALEQRKTKVVNTGNRADLTIIRSDIIQNSQPQQPSTSAQKKRDKKKRQADNKLIEKQISVANAERLKQRGEIVDELQRTRNFKKLAEVKDTVYITLLRLHVNRLYDHLAIARPTLGEDVYEGLKESVLTNAQLLQLMAEVKKTDPARAQELLQYR